jgi:phosphopantetheinyl transferase
MEYVEKVLEKDIDIFIAKIRIDEEKMLEEVSLSSQEKMKYAEMTSKKRRQEWLTYRVLLSNVLGKEFILEYQSNGKPYLLQPKKNISISHSKEYVAIAIAEKKIGIDIEKIDTRILKLKEKILNSREVNRFVAADERVLHIIWGIKESVYKQQDEEINYLEDIEVKKIDENTAEVQVKNHLQKVEFFEIDNNMIVVSY